jgi:hypothetical protein
MSATTVSPALTDAPPELRDKFNALPEGFGNFPAGHDPRELAARSMDILRLNGWKWADVIELQRYFPDSFGKLGCEVIRELWYQNKAPLAEAPLAKARDRTSTYGDWDISRPWTGGQAHTPKLKLLRVVDACKSAERQYLVKGLIYRGELSVWWGQPKCGKSFLLSHIGYAIAQGRTVLGRKVKGCRVLHIHAEGQSGIGGRLSAMVKEYGLTDNFLCIAQPVDLYNEEGHLSELIEHAKAERIGLVIVDTMNRVLAGASENRSEDIGQFIRNVDRIREETGAHLAIIHHGTKEGSTPRGHSSLEGAADLIVEVVKKSNGRCATVRASRDDAEGASIPFALRVVDLGADDDGEPVSTCVVQEIDAPSANGWVTADKAEYLPDQATNALSILHDVVAGPDGQLLPKGEGLPTSDIRGVPVSVWRAAYQLRYAHLKSDTVNKAFRRQMDKLQARSRIGVCDGWVWPVQQPGPN